MAAGRAASEPTETSPQPGSDASASNDAYRSSPPFDEALERRLERLAALDGRIAELAEDLSQRLDVTRRGANEAFGRHDESGAPGSPDGAATTVRKARRPRARLPKVRLHIGAGTVRRLAAGIAVIAVAAGAGLLAGRWAADDDSTSTAAPDRVELLSADHAKRFERQIDALGAARKAKLEQLRSARTPGAQAAALEALADTHRRASERLTDLDLPAELRGANDSAITAIERIAGAYRDLSVAAAKGDAGDYDENLKAVRRAELSLEERVERN
jgi:hypothetical protein